MLLLLKSNTAGALAASVGITLTVAATLTVTPASGAALAASLPVTINTVAALNATSSSLTAGLPITLGVVANLTTRPPAALLSTLAIRLTTAANLTVTPAAAGNLTSGTAIPITLPYSTTQDVNSAGISQTVWYVLVPTQSGLVSIWAFGDLITYQPTLEIFSPDGVTSHATATSTNKPLQFYAELGVNYFFKISSSTGNVTPAVLTLTAEMLPEIDAPLGSIAVNDDTNALPLILLRASDGLPVGVRTGFPAGEQADVLDNGTVAIEDISGATIDTVAVQIWDAALAHVATDSIASSGWQRTYIGSNKTSKFYLGWSEDYDHFTGEPSYRTLTAAGVSSAWVQLAGQRLTGLAPSNDESILYYSGRIGAGNLPIKQWNIAGGVALADLVANLAGYTPGTILVLADGTLVVLYVDPLTLDTIVKHYSAAGATLHTHSYGSSGDPRMASSVDHASYWIWLKPTVTPGGSMTGVSQFKNVAADGTVLSTISSAWFEKGVYGPTATATPTSLFGHSESCPFWVTRASVVAPPEPPTPAGTLIVQKTTDTADPDAEFTFTVSGGLSPATFTLKHGESRTFADITPGTYAVAETILPTGWTLGSAVVSNGDLVSAITIDDGETVTALFTNVAPPVAEHVCPPATESIACWNGFTGAELQVRRVAE